nr:MAG TPA: hypothetical protein [Caudoviricetes sp.]
MLIFYINYSYSLTCLKLIVIHILHKLFTFYMVCLYGNF